MDIGLQATRLICLWPNQLGQTPLINRRIQIPSLLSFGGLLRESTLQELKW